MVLQAVGNSPGDKVIQTYPSNNVLQRWKLHEDGTIRLVHSNLCLDVSGESASSGTKIIVWPFHGKANQRWRLIQE
jgi:alpha-galactosidase